MLLHNKKLEEARIKKLDRMSDHAPIELEVWKKERKKVKWRVDDHELERVEMNKQILEEIAKVNNS